MDEDYFQSMHDYSRKVHYRLQRTLYERRSLRIANSTSNHIFQLVPYV